MTTGGNIILLTWGMFRKSKVVEEQEAGHQLGTLLAAGVQINRGRVAGRTDESEGRLGVLTPPPVMFLSPDSPILSVDV